MNQISMKKQIRQLFYKTTLGKFLWKALAFVTFRTIKKPTFRGWGMITFTSTPWDYNSNQSAFKDSNDLVNQKILNDELILSQFSYLNKTQLLKELSNLQWRHYIVNWSAEFVLKSCVSSKNFVECGVCDGLTIFYAILASKKQGKYFLYDSWAPMINKNLHETEEHLEGRYSNLVLENTKRNLNQFDNLIYYNVGYIPDSFSTSNNPDDICWLHIDINSAFATIESLLYFYPKLASRGIILFDDYAQLEFAETKKLIDSFFEDKDGIFLHLPTGQGIYFKN